MADEETTWDGDTTTWDRDWDGPGTRTRWDLIPAIIGRRITVVWQSVARKVKWVDPRRKVKWR